jgi:hypothetical protein
MLANSITPPVRYDAKPITFKNDAGEDRCYVLVFVEPSSELHQVSLADVATSYRRVGRNSVPMGPEEIRLRVEAILETARRLEDQIEERLETLPREAALVYTVVMPDAPFLGPILDPASSTFREEMNKLMSGLTFSTFEPSSTGCKSAFPYTTALVEVSVTRDGMCEFVDSRVVNPREAYDFIDPGQHYHSPLGFVTRIRSRSAEQADVWAHKVWVDRMVSELRTFLTLSCTGLRLMGYEGRVRIVSRVLPTPGASLVLRMPYQGGYTMMERALDVPFVEASTESSTWEIEDDPNSVLRRLALRLFETFGAEQLSPEVEEALTQR